jgi:hypothetical protein
MCVTLACVVLGLVTIAPGFGIPLGVIAFIAWMRTISKDNWQAEDHAPSSAPEVLLTFIRSVGLVLLVLGLIALAAFALFFVMCLAAFGAPTDSASTAIFVVGAIILAGAIIGLMVIFNR